MLLGAAAVGSGLVLPVLTASPALAGHSCSLTLTGFGDSLYISANGTSFLYGNIDYKVTIWKSGQSSVYWTSNWRRKYNATSFNYHQPIDCGGG